jgi:hypothetical protein
MFRRTFDILMTSAGAAITVLLIAGGALLFWGYSFADTNVHEQLAAQRITFPEKGSEALKPPEIGTYLNKYAGQQLTTGAQAEAYANHFIAVHLTQSTGGRTYSELSTESRANPTDTKLAGLVQTAFRGETLRGLLLNAYAFWKIGQLAKIGMYVAFAAAAAMALLTGLGLWHIAKGSPRERFLAPRAPAKQAA